MIRSLSIEYSDIANIIANDHLTELSIRFCSGLNHIHRFANLNILNIDRCDLTDNTIAGLNQLSRLSIKHTTVNIADLADISIEHLIISAKRLIGIDHIGDMQLLSLRISADFDYNCIEFLSSHLTKLELMDGQMHNLFPIRHLVNLVHLNLRNMKLSCIKNINLMKNLVHVNVCNNEIDDVVPLLTLMHLKYLDVSDNPVMKKITSLTAIKLLDIGISYKIVEAINNSGQDLHYLADEMKGITIARMIKSCE